MKGGRPTAGTEVLAMDRGRTTNVFSRPWMDWVIWVTSTISGTGETPPEGSIPSSAILVSASDRVLGRSSPGSGPAEELVFSDQAQELVADTSFEDMRATLEISAENTPYSPLDPWADDVAEALDYLKANVFDVNTILTDGESVLVDHNGNVLTS